MNTLLIAGGLIAVALMAFMLAALLHPEDQ